MIYLLSMILSSAFATDFFPNFYGDYTITNWSCESTTKDPGCMDSARIVVRQSRSGVSEISVYNSSGTQIRWNELIEKSDSKNSAVLAGDDNSATFTVEAKDSSGKRYFYNLFEMRRFANGELQFSHVHEASLAGLENRIKRVFAVNRN